VVHRERYSLLPATIVDLAQTAVLCSSFENSSDKEGD
jgi:hypothetical protein